MKCKQQLYKTFRDWLHNCKMRSSLIDYNLLTNQSSPGCSHTNVTFHGIYSFPQDSFIVGVSMHFWATLDMTCSGSQGDLVSPVRGAWDAPPMKSVSYQAVCAVISVSSDVKV